MTTFTTKCLAITLSPKPLDLTCLKQWDFYTPILYKLLNSYSDYEGRVELTLKGKIHYHLQLNIKTPKELKQWLTRSINSLQKVGNTKIKIIEDEENSARWLEYCHKDDDFYDNIFINRNCNISPCNAPKIKDLKLLIEAGVTCDLDEGIKITKNCIIKKYNKTINIQEHKTTVNQHIKTKTIKSKPEEIEDS